MTAKHVQYVKGTSQDRDELIDLANMVFSQHSFSHDFKKLLPKVYSDEVDPEWMSSVHYLAKVDGRIRGLIACPIITMNYPEPQTENGHDLKLGLVGTVSTHLYSRGEGHMKALMKMMIDDSRERGADMLVLGGRHQRYQLNGFDQAGVQLVFVLSEPSMKKSFGHLDVSGFSVQPLKADDPLLDEAYAIYCRQAVRDVSRERSNFHLWLRSWAALPYALLRNNTLIGYACMKDRTINELVLDNEDLLSEALMVLYNTFAGGADLTFPVQQNETGRVELLVPACEAFSLHEAEMVRVHNWKNVLIALLGVKKTYAVLPDTNTVLSLDGQLLRLCIRDQKITVEETDEEPSLILSGPEGIRAAFSNAQLAVPSMNRLPGVFPLPLILPRQDHF